MVTKQQAEEIIHALQGLPEDKVLQVHDFVLFLKGRYGKTPDVDERGDWTDEDLRDLSIAVGKYADEVVPWSEKPAQTSNERRLEF